MGEKRDRQARWDRVNLQTVSCKLTLTMAARYAAACRARGVSMHSVAVKEIRQYLKAPARGRLVALAAPTERLETAIRCRLPKADAQQFERLCRFDDITPSAGLRALVNNWTICAELETLQEDTRHDTPDTYDAPDDWGGPWEDDGGAGVLLFEVMGNG